jgi:hypothetical protein
MRLVSSLMAQTPILMEWRKKESFGQSAIQITQPNG